MDTEARPTDMAQAIPYIIAAVGTYAQMKSSQDAADERRGILNQQLERDDQTKEKVNSAVLTEAQKLNPADRKNAISDQEGQIYQQSQKDLQAGAGGGDIGAVDTTGGAGNVSDDFLKAKADRAVSEGNRLTDIARELSKTRAPGQLKVNEGYSQGNLASELQDIGGTNQNYARAASADANSVQEGNLGGFGKIASSIGMGMAAGGYGQGATPGQTAYSGMSAPMSKGFGSQYGVSWNVK